MKRSFLPLILALGIPLPLPNLGAAGEFSQSKGPARLEVRFDAKNADTNQIALADEIGVMLMVEGTPELIVQAALELPTSEPWDRTYRSLPTREPIAGGRIRWRIIYRFMPRQPGKLAFAFPPVKIRDGAGEEQTVTWDSVPFQVAAGGGDLRDITAIEETPATAPPSRAWPIALAGSAAGGILIALLLGWRRMARRIVPRTPEQLAEREWERLIGLKLPEKGQSERFITLLTLLVRRYLERRYALSARRQTTPEFLRGLSANASLPADAKQFLSQFLERCDAIKFANAAMSPDECSRWAQATRQFVTRHQAQG